MSHPQDAVVFARLSEDKKSIAEYPVFGLHIRNRAHPYDWYTEVTFDPQPEVPAFHASKEVLTIRGSQVFATYELIPDTLDQILSNLYNQHYAKAMDGAVNVPTTPLKFSDVPAEAVARIKKLAKDYAQKRMDDFAAIKEYDNIGSACNYFNSNNALFKADADKCIAIRDAVWVTFINYFEAVVAGTEDIPKTSDEIGKKLPEMDWNS